MIQKKMPVGKITECVFNKLLSSSEIHKFGRRKCKRSNVIFGCKPSYHYYNSNKKIED